MKTYVIMGKPVPLSRPRFSTATRKVFDPQKEFKTLVSMSLISQHNDDPLLTGALHLDVVFYMPIPQRSLSKNLAGTPHCKKPDLSNLLKWVEDISTGVIYRDDALISSVESKKIYDANPRTEFTLRCLHAKPAL